MIVGIEVGGTFTDLIAVTEDGQAHIHKTPSTPDDPSRAAISGLAELLGQMGATGNDVTELLHGSTIAANALIQRRGAKVALLTTQGFRDVLFIQRMDKSIVYDMFYQKPEPLISREMAFEVAERLDAKGRVVTPLDETAVAELVDGLVREEGVQSIAVCFLHAYANPVHERAVGALIAARYPDVYVSLSSDVSPEHREYERVSTTVISAFIRPVVDRYLLRFEAEARRLGVKGAPLIMLSNGGVAPVAAARQLAANMFLSGPAAAVTGAAALAQLTDTPNIISIDVGGTSSDVCLITDGAPQTTVKGTSEFSVEGLPLNIVMTDIVSIGAGGGSIAWVDAGGMLQVGPRSAGATPGPACYDSGGDAFCLTDAMLLLGLMDPAVVLPGGIKLDRTRSHQVAAPLMARLNLSVLELAEHVYRIAASNMAQALRRVSVKRGFDPRQYTLFPCGGAGALIAAAVADEVAIDEILIPPNPGVFSAIGLTVSDVRIDYVLAESAQLLSTMTAGELAEKLAGLRQRAMHEFAALAYPTSELKFNHACDARYLGQGYELRLDIDAERLNEHGPTYLTDAFHAEHARRYGHAFKDRQVEVISFRLSAVWERDRVAMSLPKLQSDKLDAERSVRIGGEDVRYRVLERASLPLDYRGFGPMLIVEASTSTLVPPSWKVEAAAGGALRLTRKTKS